MTNSKALAMNAPKPWEDVSGKYLGSHLHHFQQSYWGHGQPSGSWGKHPGWGGCRQGFWHKADGAGAAWVSRRWASIVRKGEDAAQDIGGRPATVLRLARAIPGSLFLPTEHVSHSELYLGQPRLGRQLLPRGNLVHKAVLGPFLWH